MKKISAVQILDIMAPIWILFEKDAPSDMVIRAWANLFSEVEPVVFAKALKAAALEPGRRFFPRPGEVTQKIQEMREATGEGVSPEGAWDMVLSMAAASLSFDRVKKQLENYPEIIGAVRQCGWENIRYADVETKLPFIRKTFLEHMEREMDRRQAVAPHSVGMLGQDSLPMDLIEGLAKIKLIN